MKSHLDILAAKSNRIDTLREAAHDDAIQEYAQARPSAIDALVEELAAAKSQFSFSPADGSAIRRTKSGMLRAIGMIPREQDEKTPHTNAVDVLYLVMDRFWERQAPKAGTLRQRWYREILTTVVAACLRHGIEVPVQHPVLVAAMERAGVTPTSIGLPAAELRSEPTINYEVLNVRRNRPGPTRDEPRYGAFLTRRVEDARIERGGVAAGFAAMMDDEPDHDAIDATIKRVERGTGPSLSVS